MADIYQVNYGGRSYSTLSAALLAAVDDIEAQFARLPYFYQRAMKDFLDETAKDIVSSWTPYSPGYKAMLQVRSGDTKKELLNSVETDGSGTGVNAKVTGYIGGPHHLNILEDGGTLTAKGGGYLTIPLPAALDSRGLPLKKSMNEWPNTFTKMTKAGNLVVFQRRRGTVVPLYVLKKSVKYRKMLGMGDALDRRASYFEDRVMDYIEMELEGRV